MFGLGMPEILLILAIALMVIGPKKLPDMAKSLGRALGEFKRAAQEFKNSIDLDDTVKEFNEPIKNIKNDLKSFSDPLSKPLDANKSSDNIDNIKEENIKEPVVGKYDSHVKEPAKELSIEKEELVYEKEPQVNLNKSTENLNELKDGKVK